MTKHFGFVDRGVVQLDFWLTVDAGDPRVTYNRRPSVRVSASAPNVSRRERAINLKMTLPLTLFETPSISASINVESPTEVVHIDAAAVADAVRSAIGMDVDIRVARPGEPE